MLTKKHFQRMAEIIGRSEERYETTLNQLTADVIRWFEEENPRFDADRFKEAIKAARYNEYVATHPFDESE